MSQSPGKMVEKGSFGRLLWRIREDDGDEDRSLGIHIYISDFFFFSIGLKITDLPLIKGRKISFYPLQKTEASQI